ncbi:flagellar basal body L-ring protein FlgH [Aliarcobacter cryaerophilus]|uniref:Flagellar L-ring protein n=1 Tax=Aliarcobacter cryaerophilus TaxID=28198 RepID=A0AA46NMJ6_9BACT|nr:flagellar basal body L-ring protein FlgH [Aliarcobacter cryaerophilus]UYF43094.1 flagellar basal body L-ring protein FlgH [Aliarcobacter cryaerophilus]
MKNILFLFIISLLFTSCGALTEPKIDFTKPPQQVTKEPPVVRKNKGSLYSVQGTSLFADKKDLQVGDIIQVVISEGITQKSDNKRELTSDRKNEFGGGMFASMGGNPLNSTVGNVTNKANSVFGVNFNTESSDSDKGKVKTQVNENFDTKISAIIDETYQNGNYFIKGNKEVIIDGQKQEIVITGVIRPYDITSDNSINSSQIANLKMLYKKDGAEADLLQVPWGTKILRAIWPF